MDICITAHFRSDYMKNAAKKMVSVLLSAVIAGSLATASFAAGVKYGDTDLNAQINSADALAVLLHATDKELLTGDKLKAADVNGDGVINSSDALEILLYAVGKIDRFSVEKTVVPATDKEILSTYAEALKKAREEKPSYRIKSDSIIKDVDAKVSDPLGLLKLGGSSAAEMEKQMKDEMLDQSSTYQTIVRQKTSESSSNLPAECKLTDPSVLASISAVALANGNLKITIKFRDEKNPKAGSPVCKGLGMANYDEVAAEFAESSEVEGMTVKTSLDELSYKNSYIICEINQTTGEFVNLEWNTEMYTKTTMSMVVGVTAIMTDKLHTVYSDFGY